MTNALMDKHLSLKHMWWMEHILVVRNKDTNLSAQVEAEVIDICFTKRHKISE